MASSAGNIAGHAKTTMTILRDVKRKMQDLRNVIYCITLRWSAAAAEWLNWHDYAIITQPTIHRQAGHSTSDAWSMILRSSNDKS